MKFRFALIAAFASLIGCGDNSNECGPGTHAVDGLCTPDSSATCSDGTILDSSTGSCVIDPDACQGGTVLVGSQCVEPGQVTADLEEAAEPNGLGIFGEDSNTSAGMIALKPVGEHFVVHGKIVPFQDMDGDGQLDADTDTYLISVTQPTMLSVSADGLNGLAGGFAFVAAVDADDPLATWERIGINLTGDTSKRQVYLPVAGNYAVTIADTRTLFLSGGAAGAEEGKPAFEYYVTLDALAATPEVLAPTDGVATKTGQIAPGEVKLFTLPAGTGFNSATFDAAAPQINESLVMLNTHGAGTVVKAVGDYDSSTDTPPSVSTLGPVTGDTITVVVDNVYNFAAQPSDYTLTVKAAIAGVLSATGGDSTAISNTTDITTFTYNVATADEITGMDITFDKPISGAIIDKDGFIFSWFTYDPNVGFSTETTGYTGHLREPTPGTYYFAVVDLNLATDTGTIGATSSYGPVTATAATEGTAANLTATPYDSNAITYAAGTTDGWQQFSGGATLGARFYNPATAYGRLDAFGPEADCSNTAIADTCTADVAPIWAVSLNATAKGRILLDDGTTNYLISARNTAATTFTGARRDHVQLTPTAGGAAATDNGTLDTTTTVRRYLIKSAAGNVVTTTVDGNATTDAVVKPVSNVETTISTINATGVDGIETHQTILGASGWIALTVNATTPAAGQGFALSSLAVAGVNYTKTAGTTAYADACSGGGAVVTLNDLDEGVSGALSAPAGFKLFGFAATTFRMFSNGFISFETSTCPSVGSSCYFSNPNLPTTAAPNAVIAPYWDDLVLTDACIKTAGTKTILEWKGSPFLSSAIVHVQAILDGSNNTIEFVYAPDHDAALTGAGATIGLESTAGLAGYVAGFNTAGTVAAGTSILLTPM